MNKIYGVVFIMLLMCALTSKAQLNPLAAQYYNNEYLMNPAYAGREHGLILNAAYRKLWNDIPGAPLTQNITAAYGFNRVGIGLKVNAERAGLLRQTRVSGTYAYHLPLDSGRHQLHFGISLGMMSQQLESSDISGNPNDISIGDYNGRKTYLDGDFGIGYTFGNLNMQLAIPNLKDFFGRDMANVADIVTFYMAAAYQIGLNDNMQVEPKIAFRGVRNYKNMIDAGAQLSVLNGRIKLMGMYHSNESMTGGLGIDFMHKYFISGMYTSQTSALNSYANGSFEINFRLNLTK
jgi:type IX secretion system PorP/SprF family membrane protein